MFVIFVYINVGDICLYKRPRYLFILPFVWSVYINVLAKKIISRSLDLFILMFVSFFI